MRHLLTIVLMTALTVSCGGGRTEAGADAAEGSSGSLPVVAGPAIPLSNLAELHVSQTQRIDGHEADLPDINWVGGTEGGVVAIITMMDKQVRLYGPDGQLIAAAGRPGSGPGEFEWPNHGGWRGDTLWVADSNLRRLTLVDPIGRITRLTPPLLKIQRRGSSAGANAAYGTPLAYALLPGDTMLVSALPTGVSTSQILRVSPDGWIERVLLDQPHAMPGRISYELPRGGGSMDVPFYPTGRWRASPYGSAIVRLDPESSYEGTFRVTLITTRGDTIYSRTYWLEPIRIPKAVIDRAVMDRVGGARTSIEKNAVRTKLPGLMPAVYPVYGLLLVLDEGDCTWLHMQPYSGRNEWLRLDRSGDPQGRVVLPPQHYITAAHGRHLWAVETDENDVESLVRFEVSRCTD
jgi:hypothetical protein